MGSMEVPSQSGGILKVPHSTYEFGANVLDQNVRDMAWFDECAGLHGIVDSALSEGIKSEH